MEGVYSVFNVYDYKGGELNYTTNVDYDRVLSEYFERYYDYIYDNLLEDDEEVTFEKIKEFYQQLDEDEEVYSTYAGYNGSSYPEVFKVDGNKLVRVDIDDILDDGINWIVSKILKKRESK